MLGLQWQAFERDGTAKTLIQPMFCDDSEQKEQQLAAVIGLRRTGTPDNFVKSRPLANFH
jgi:hypothetical protein